MITRAIGRYESLFSDPITIQILFRYSTHRSERFDPLLADVLRTISFCPLHSTMERFYQRFESRRNNQQRQYSECHSASERVIYRHRAI